MAIKITFTNLPEDLEAHLLDLGGDYNSFETKLTFDMDSSGTLSTRDIVLGLRSESIINADGSLNQLTETTLRAKVVHGPGSYDRDFNLESFTRNENVIIFTAKASEIGWINDINSDTPINVASKVMNGTRITEGENSFRLNRQHVDFYPAEEVYTSGVDIGLLEDPQGDIDGGSMKEVVVDILSIEITLSE